MLITMNESPYNKNKGNNVLAGKGFYLVLAFCLIGAGAAAWAAASRTVGDVNRQNSSIVEQLSQAEGGKVEWVEPEEQQTARSTPDIPKESASSSSAPSSPSSAASSSEPTVATGQSAQQVPLDKPQPSVFMLPIEGSVLSDYSDGKLVKNETLKVWRTHDGVDIKAAKGSEVKCAADGQVSKVYEDPLWGMVVEVEHTGGLVSIYCGLEKPAKVKIGTAVDAGAVLGTLGVCPSEQLSESHLHMGLKQDGKWVNPLKTMNKI